jgi:hypothetical protein
MQYYEVDVQITTETEDSKGNVKVKKSKQVYLVDAMSITEAEAKVVKLFEGYSNDFEVVRVAQSKIVEVVKHEEKPKKEVNVKEVEQRL